MVSMDRFFETKGQFIKAVFQSEKKPAAAHKGTSLKKITSGVFRAGINFANLKTVKERGDVQPLPWGNWMRFPYLIEHKGEQYVRLYPANGGKVSVNYFVNGQAVDKAVFNSYLTPSEANRTEPAECFTIKADNIISLGKEAVETVEAAEAA